MASYDEIVDNGYNLSVASYVETSNVDEDIDIKQLNSELDRIVSREEELRKAISTIINEIEVGE